jgi:quinol monooxygenase YgiN
VVGSGAEPVHLSPQVDPYPGGENMHLTFTTGTIKPNQLEAAIALFRDSVPGLYVDHHEWNGLRLCIDRQSRTITVIGFWRSAEAFERFRQGEPYKTSLERFNDMCETPVQVNVQEVLVELDRQDSAPDRIVVH